MWQTEIFGVTLPTPPTFINHWKGNSVVFCFPIGVAPPTSIKIESTWWKLLSNNQLNDFCFHWLMSPKCHPPDINQIIHFIHTLLYIFYIFSINESKIGIGFERGVGCVGCVGSLVGNFWVGNFSINVSCVERKFLGWHPRHPRHLSITERKSNGFLLSW